MTIDAPSLRMYALQLKDKAKHVLGAEHTGADAKGLIKDLIDLGEKLECLIEQSSGQSADVRMLRKKLDLGKQETKAAESRVESLQKEMALLVAEVKSIAVEVAAISKRHPEATDPDALSASKVKAANQKIAEVIVKATQTQQKTG